MSFVPFVGWALGLITATIIAIVQFWPDYMPILIVIGIFVGAQVLDAGFLSPNIVGSKIGLHPVWLIFSLFVFSYLFGFVGVLVAVPIAAAVGVLVRFAIKVYLASGVYTRRGGCAGAAAVRDTLLAMTATPRQLVLDLAHRQALGEEDFLVSSSNAAAVELIDHWPDWPHPASVVVGPEGSGKSHLANVWRLRSSAPSRSPAAELADAFVAALPERSALVVEDLDRGIGDEHALFHLLNRARESKLSVLLTSRSAPGDLSVGLPDLRSRLRALPVVGAAAARRGAAQGGAGQAVLRSPAQRGAGGDRLPEPAHGALDGGGEPCRCGRRSSGARHAPQGDAAPGGGGPGGSGARAKSSDENLNIRGVCHEGVVL